MRHCVAMLAVGVALLGATAAQEQYKGYFQYLNVKAPKEYEHGYKRGNEYHNRDHYQQNKDHRFRAKVGWNDKSGGSGEHYFEYNHAPKQAEYKEPAPYAPEPAPYAPEPAPYAPEPAPYAPEPAPYVPVYE
ncbi:uncharacterized protein LOC122391686 [Amphibalanus amphitrite]|uniref:uncharacterized protein LOC122391686 n=1 Tax=Amphibalanus amphitrite TaxID=1232801 RepID=UPI001C90FF5B|nr:uncharacterized protein LOC122391686 [Amphibalanus amphitrite]